MGVLQNFVSRALPVVSAAWLNGVDLLVNGVFNGATTPAEARTNLTSDKPLEITNGGTGARNVVDAVNNLGLLTSGAITSAFIGGLMNPLSDNEISAGVVPLNFAYRAGDLRRYGAIGAPAGALPGGDDSAAWATAVSTGTVIIPDGMAFRIVTGTSFNGKVVVRGFGQGSQIYNDSVGNQRLITLTNGDYSLFEDFFVGGITLPLTIQRNVKTTVVTNGTCVFNSANVTVANPAGIVVGMSAFGPPLFQGCLVTAVSGNVITLSDLTVAAGTAFNVEFAGITFNIGLPAQGVNPLTTLQQSNSKGRQAPTNNDVDVWPSLTAAQQALTQVGPILLLTGDNITVRGVTGNGLSLNFVGSHCNALNNNLTGGWGFASIAFLSPVNNSVRFKNNTAIGNYMEDHSNNGVLFMACDGCTVIGNTAVGLGESGFKTYQGAGISGYFDGCTQVTSQGNRSIACFQGGFDYQQQFPNNGASSGLNISMGDYSSFCPNTAFAYSGSGWNINIMAEFNPGASLYAIINDSIVSGIFRENMYNSANGGIANNMNMLGYNNTVTGVRCYQKTARWTASTGYQFAFTSGVIQQNSSSITNCDFRDAFTLSGTAILRSGHIDMWNVRTNGLEDRPIETVRQFSPTYAPVVQIDASQGNRFLVVVTDSTPFTIQNVISSAGSPGQRITISIFNTTNAPIGAATFDSLYRVGVWTQPGPFSNRSVTLEGTGSGGFYEINRTPVDVPT